MLATDPEFLNRRLGNQRFLTHPADLKYYEDLRARVEGLARPQASLSIPDVGEAHAWQRLFALYSALKKRPRAESNHESTFQGGADLAWDAYVRDLDAIRTLARNDVGSWALLSEYVGIERGDLDDPVPPPDHPEAQWGRYSDWQHRAGRISSALGQLRRMQPRERAIVPEIVSQRRRDRMIEQRFTALEQKVLALESRLPSMQEILLRDEETNYGEQYDG
jgi:hypothetical protein